MQAPLGNPQHMYGHSTWEPGLAVAAKPLLMRPLHDVLALAEVLDVVKPAATKPINRDELLLCRQLGEISLACSGHRTRQCGRKTH